MHIRLKQVNVTPQHEIHASASAIILHNSLSHFRLAKYTPFIPLPLRHPNLLRNTGNLQYKPLLSPLNTMADPISTPRITSQHLEHFTNRTIRLLGKVTQLRGDQATIDSDGSVTCMLNRDAHLTVGNAVEVVGKVNRDLTVKVLSATDMGKDGKVGGFFFCRQSER